LDEGRSHGHEDGKDNMHFLGPRDLLRAVLSKGYIEVPSSGIEPAPPCPEAYVATKYRALKSVPDGDIYLSYIIPLYCPSNELPQYIHYLVDR
jgi:hypothetical protein